MRTALVRHAGPTYVLLLNLSPCLSRWACLIELWRGCASVASLGKPIQMPPGVDDPADWVMSCEVERAGGGAATACTALFGLSILSTFSRCLDSSGADGECFPRAV
eukprot:scaffold117202_cov30-Tisochrysis_lutea.AAC.3